MFRIVMQYQDFEDAMRVVKMALLEADVNFKVVKEFVATVKEKALASVSRSLEGLDVKKVIVVKGRLVNIVAK